MNILKKITNLKSHNGVKKYLANTSWLLGEKIIRMTVGLFVGIWVARYLGPEQFGLYNYAQSFVALFTVFATLGLNNIVIRELVKNEGRRDEILGTAFALKLVAGIFTLLLLAVILLSFNFDTLTILLIFLIGSGTIFQSFSVIDFYFQSRVQSKYVVFVNAIAFFINSSLKVYCILIEAPLIYFAIIILVDNLILAIGFAFYYKKQKLNIFKWQLKFKVAKQLLKDSWPLIFSSLVVTIYMKIDQIMIKHMLSDYDVGQYAAAVKLSESWYFVPTVITASLFPAILNAKKISQEIFINRLQKLFNFMFVISVSAAIVTYFLSDWVILKLFGVDYSSAGNVLNIYIWAGIFISFGLTRTRWILAENLQVYSLICLFAGMIINIITNYFLIPIYGINGAAYATLLGQGFGNIVMPVFFSKTRVIFVIMISSLTGFSLVKNLIRK